MFFDEMGYIDIFCVDYFGIVFDYIYSQEFDFILMDIDINGNFSGL